MAAVKQIDWESPEGGQGAVQSFQINHVELLDAPIYPSGAYLFANYPHCDDMFNIFPPYGNGVIGANGRRAIGSAVTSNLLPITLRFEWDGPHEAQPVCSMSGVSFVGYAELTLFIEAQENAGT